ncbi:MAG: hypothetical protein QXH07_05240 [Thermoplasmata archaeon]
MEDGREIESTLLKSDVVNISMKKIIQESLQNSKEFKDLILEKVLKQIVKSPELRKRF